MKNGRIDIASIRRGQIVDAASAVIAEQGLHNLSLSEIEAKTGMKRGQLTYYFKTKEEILLAVWDRVLEMMRQHMRDGTVPCHGEAATAWDKLNYLLPALLLQPPMIPEFNVLQYTFLAQIGIREDFRQRLATLYETWRSHMAADLTRDAAAGTLPRPVPARAMSTLVQALLHGLVMQLAADPQAFDRAEVLDLCLDVLGTYLGVKPAPPSPRTAARPKKPAAPRRQRPAARTAAKE